MIPATIVYLPHCAKCGALIEEKPRYSISENKVVTNDGETLGILSTFVQIEPERCKVCDAYFTRIEMEPPERVD